MIGLQEIHAGMIEVLAKMVIMDREGIGDQNFLQGIKEVQGEMSTAVRETIGTNLRIGNQNEIIILLIDLVVWIMMMIDHAGA